jgi:hypothetical protein
MSTRDLTPDGAKWLRLALDPFCDDDLQVRALPDGSATSTIPYVIKATHTYTTVGAASDLHIAVLPGWTGYEDPTDAEAGETLSPVNYDASYMYQVDDNPIIYPPGPVHIINVNTGEPTYPNESCLTFAPVGFAAAGMDLHYAQDATCRVIGLGLEVTNTTPAITASGTVTCYRIPSSYRHYWATEHVYQFEGEILPPDGSKALQKKTGPSVKDPRVRSKRPKNHCPDQAVAPLGGEGVTIFNHLPGMGGMAIPQPPSTAEEAVNIPGSRTWRALDGAYLVARLNSVHSSKFHRFLPGGLLLERGNTPYHDLSAALYGFGLLGAMGDPSQGETAMYHWVWGNNVADFDLMGAYFTGLPVGTTLTIVLNAYLEIKPTINVAAGDPTLLMVRPSPPYDQRALRAYAIAASNLPVAVPQTENPAGEYGKKVWRAIGTAMKTIAPVVATGLLGPEAGLATELGIQTGAAIAAAAKKRRAIVRPQAQMAALTIAPGQPVSRSRARKLKQRAAAQHLQSAMER